MGFGDVWMSWMEAFIFSSHMSVMVNGSPTKELTVERGLRQGDSISPFLYVIVAEGLKWLINRAVENGIYAGSSVYGKCFIDVIQFADDTLMAGDGSWNHLWTIKSDVSVASMGGWSSNGWIWSDIGIPHNIRSEQQLEPMLSLLISQLDRYQPAFAGTEADSVIHVSVLASPLLEHPTCSVGTDRSILHVSATTFPLMQQPASSAGTYMPCWSYDNEG
ncbi:uncharacterized protein LOC131597440 [Vicia villosa]|uniref:uncharacterized protein LOC131597440 n=1 Tax=Vicia villosa TaxID=3911 RepID=UPI00273C810D|nr:uncharacterized protein LOC131597440 [Vicia villosa]